MKIFCFFLHAVAGDLVHRRPSAGHRHHAAPAPQQSRGATRLGERSASAPQESLHQAVVALSPVRALRRQARVQSQLDQVSHSLAGQLPCARGASVAQLRAQGRRVGADPGEVHQSHYARHDHLSDGTADRQKAAQRWRRRGAAADQVGTVDRHAVQHAGQPFGSHTAAQNGARKGDGHSAAARRTVCGASARRHDRV